MSGKNDLSPSRALAVKVTYAAMNILKENGGSMTGKDVIEQVEKRIEFNDWEKGRYERSGYIRWQSILHFYTIDCIKAGYLVKKKGIWYLTPEGEKALKLGDVEFLDSASEAYRKWDRERKTELDEQLVEGEGDEEKEREVTVDEMEYLAIEGIEKFLKLKNAYEFQDIAAALLRGMGYFTPFIAPKGKDGGVDVMAYRDPLGTSSPRIKVQVKHRESPANVQEMRQLMGLLQKDGDVGIFISSGGFTPDAISTARSSHVHVELIDLSRFIELWQSFYNKLSDEDKALCPLIPIYFIAPT